ncbi:MAG: hypothetical protein KatS3mg105_3610 [Gemmatales bacterium]|nr:MAG: hypothetical protein KatS3mg105_3610 [Gemmatales bacterium]
MFKVIGRFSAAYPWILLAAWILSGIGLSLCAPEWETKTQDDDIHFLPARKPSVRGYNLLKQAFPDDVNQSKAILVVEREDRPLDSSDFQLVDRVVSQLLAKKEAGAFQIVKVSSYRDPLIGERLTSKDKHCTLIQVALDSPFLALKTRDTLNRLSDELDSLLAGEKDPPTFLITGPAGIGRDLINASADSLDGTTVATVLLVVVVLLLVYRAPLLALIPLMTIGISVWVALKLLALLTLIPGVHLVNVAKVFAIVILYGAGTDYCLFLISRYQEELYEGQDIFGAISRSVMHVGGALSASAGTVICGLGLMGFAEFAKVRCAGPAIALSLAVALLASLTLAPALLRLAGAIAFWPRQKPGPENAPQHNHQKESFWERVSHGVIARPVLVWSVAFVALLPLALVGLGVRPNYRPTGELHPKSDSVRGIKVIQRHFTAGEIGPLTVLLTSKHDFASEKGRQLIAHLSRGFLNLDNVAEVRSLTQPLGEPLRFESPQSGLLATFYKKVFEHADQQAQKHYCSRLPGDDPRYVTRLHVVLKSDPFDPISKKTLNQIQLWLHEFLPDSLYNPGDVESECFGVTVSAGDLAEVTESDRQRVNALVLTGIFLILLVLVRKPWLAAYLLMTVLFSYYATLGATALIGHLWSNRPIDLVDWRVPFFLFTILVAVGEDYNIFLVTRLLQERKRHGDVEGTRRALAFTGGTITSCGLIMAGTFATLMLGGLGTLVQIGFALAFGVLIDTFVVRPFLVPAFMLVVYRWRKKYRHEGQKRPRQRNEFLDRITFRPLRRRLRKAG